MARVVQPSEVDVLLKRPKMLCALVDFFFTGEVGADLSSMQNVENTLKSTKC
jgi:hypothetical protein